MRNLESLCRVGVPGLVLVSVFVLVLVASACSPVRRHAVLDFVFDGVPPYMTPEERARAAELAVVQEAEVAARVQSEQRGRRGRVEKLARFTHGPFAAEECSRCHDLSRASGFRDSTDGGQGIGASAELAEAGRLHVPVVELCLRCHTDYSVDAPGNADLWTHGPVAAGWCVLCHQPHSSDYADLLVYEPSARLCSQCHLRDELLDTQEHRPVEPETGYPSPKQISAFRERIRQARERGEEGEEEKVAVVVRDCTRCHDPHRGPDRMILRPRSEWEVEAETEQDERDEGEPEGAA